MTLVASWCFFVGGIQTIPSQYIECMLNLSGEAARKAGGERARADTDTAARRIPQILF